MAEPRSRIESHRNCTLFPSFNARALGLRCSAVETVELAAAAGFAGVDLLVREIDEAGESVSELRRRLDDRGLRPGAFPLPVDWRGGSERFQSDLARLPRLADLAATLGLLRTGTWVMPETPESFSGDGPIAAIQATAQFHHERLGRIAEVLAGRSIRLGLEVIGVESFRSGKGSRFVAKLGELTERLGPLESIGPNVGILVDGFHLDAANETVDQALAWGAGQVVWVHLADLPSGAARERSAIIDHERGLPNENGAVDSRGLLETLSAAGYDGPVTVEPLAGCRALDGLPPYEVARRSYESIRRVWPNRSARLEQI